MSEDAYSAHLQVDEHWVHFFRTATDQALGCCVFNFL